MADVDENGMMSETETEEDTIETAKVPDPPSNFSIEDSMSKELLKLSFKDRVAIQEELHGVRCLAPEESPDLIDDALREFDRQLMAEKLEIQIQLQDERLEIEGGDAPKKKKKKKKNVLRNVKSDSDSDSNQPSHSHGEEPLNNNNSSNNNDRNTITATDGSNIDGNSGSNIDSGSTGCYLNDPNIRLRFLRCACFDVPKAVRRFVNFLEMNTELFGEYVAERPLHIGDFTSRREDVALQNSRNQYLPFRDRSGRRVFVGVGTCDMNIEFSLRFKLMMYQHWVASEDVETQRKGIVIVAWPTNEDSTNDDTLSWEKSIRPQMTQKVRVLQKKMGESMPLRVTSTHGYYKDTPFFRALSVLYYIGMKSEERSLYKSHFGEPTELRYALSSYGIPEQLLPLSNTGTVKTANHSKWISALRAKADRDHWRQTNPDSSSSAGGGNGNGGDGDSYNTVEEEEIVDCPGSRDVIFRKGPTYKNNPGNMYFRELIESTHDQHMKASRKEKCRITWNIVRGIEASGGRFLDWSRSREMWIVSNDREKIRTKVAACYKQYNRTVLNFQQQKLLQQQQQHTSNKSKSEKQQTIADVPQHRTQIQNPNSQQSTDDQQHQSFGTSVSVIQNVPMPIAVEHRSQTLTTPFGATNTEVIKMDRKLRDHYDMNTVPAKRRKMFSLFCGGSDGYSTLSDSSS